jgi:hypothetical protein
MGGSLAGFSQAYNRERAEPEPVAAIVASKPEQPALMCATVLLTDAQIEAAAVTMHAKTTRANERCRQPMQRAHILPLFMLSDG